MAYLFAYVGLVLALTQGVLYRRLAKRVSEPTFMAVGMVLMGVGVASLAGVNALANAHLLGFGGMLGLVMAALTVAVVGFALLTPSATALVSRRTDPERQGEILGVNQSASAMARILGPLVSLPLYFLTADHLLPYLVGGALMLGMLLLIPKIRTGEPIPEWATAARNGSQWKRWTGRRPLLTSRNRIQDCNGVGKRRTIGLCDRWAAAIASELCPASRRPCPPTCCRAPSGPSG